MGTQKYAIFENFIPFFFELRTFWDLINDFHNYLTMAHNSDYLSLSRINLTVKYMRVSHIVRYPPLS